MTEKGFLELNLEELEVLASNWAQEYDAIEKITLYRGSSDSRARYVFVVTAAPLPDEEAREKLQSDTHIIARGENILVAETIDYYNWAQVDCMHVRDDLQLAYNDLESAYKQLELRGRHASEFIDEWMWYSVEAGKEIPPGVVNDNFPVTLYEKFKQNRNLTPSQEDKKACQEIDYYERLDLTELKILAQGWAQRFSVIKQINLYRASEGGKYVLDVRIDDSDKIEYRYFTEYWIDKACYRDGDVLRDAYITPNTDYYGDWLFLLPEVGGEPLSKDNQVFPNSRLILFPRDNVDVDNKNIPEKTLPFSPCESGTKWEDIKITLIDNDTVRIETPKRNGLFSYHELGMSDKRKGSKPILIWALLKKFAEFTGCIDSQTDKYDPKLPDTAKRLNKHLKDLFGIKESIYKYHYKKHKAYITKIVFSDQTERTYFTNDALDS